MVLEEIDGYLTCSHVNFFYHYLYYRCTMCIILSFTLQWRHNERHSVSNHQHHHCLLKRLLISKLRVTGLCAGNSPGTGEFLAQMASNAENVSIWWRHHDHMHSRASITQQYLTVHNRPNTVWQDQSVWGCPSLIPQIAVPITPASVGAAGESWLNIHYRFTPNSIPCHSDECVIERPRP